MAKKKAVLETLTETKANGFIEFTPEIDKAISAAIERLKRDVPTGTLKDLNGAEKCPVCRKMIGTSGFYCKWCGQQIREVADWAQRPYQE